MNYREAGVDITRKSDALKAASEKIRQSYTPEVLWGMGAFGGLFDAHALSSMEAPAMVASTDGVGSKTLLAVAGNRYEGLGFDLVNHSINDLLVQGAHPLFFLDYVAGARLDTEVLKLVLISLAEACRAAGIPLLAGETAEIPGVYQPGALELAGTIVGVVERKRVVDGKGVRPGDVVLALPSTGLHTNGYTLARRALAGRDLQSRPPELGGLSLQEALLEPHRSYLEPVSRLLASGIEVRAMAHITGGGAAGNLPRVLPKGLGARLERGRWLEPPIFKILQESGDIDTAEMFRVFNMGMGYLMVVGPAQAQAVLELLEESRRVGEITPLARVEIV